MRKAIWKAVPFGVGVASIVGILGCPGDRPAPGPAPSGATTVENKTARAPKPILDGWTKPAFAIVLSGEQHGYMEPCGCSLTQSGGLSRRGDFFRQLDAKGWSYLPLDLGGLVRKDNQQNKLKFLTMLNALGDLGYKAMALGTEELGLERLEAGFLLTQAAQQAGASNVPTLVNANVDFTLFKGTGTAPSVPSKVLDVGGRKVGVTAVFGKGYADALFGKARDPQIVVRDPEQAIPQALAALKKENPDVLVLLSHASHEESLALVKKFPQFHLVVTAGGPDDGRDAPETVGTSLVVSVGQKGKHIGVVGYYPDNKAQPLRFELIDLDKERFGDTPKMIARLREYEQTLTANYDSVLQDLPKSPHPSGDRFVGVERCKECHKKAYGVWKDSKHAHAFESLITGRQGTKDPVPRDHDPECIACHTVGWDPQQVFPFESGFLRAEGKPDLRGQQCENCHGPGSKHVALEAGWRKDRRSVKEDDLNAARRGVRLTVAEAQKTLCYRCHDGDNDPNFSAATFPKYWDKIKHPGRD